MPPAGGSNSGRASAELGQERVLFVFEQMKRARREM
jgi:hypothetical protein